MFGKTSALSKLDYSLNTIMTMESVAMMICCRWAGPSLTCTIITTVILTLAALVLSKADGVGTVVDTGMPTLITLRLLIQLTGYGK